MSEISAQPATGLTPAQEAYVEAERIIAAKELELKPYRDALKSAKEAVVRESEIRLTGAKTFFQDQYGVVHCVTSREFISVPMQPYAIEHTRRPEFGESKGSLSITAAREAGFEPVVNADLGKDRRNGTGF